MYLNSNFSHNLSQITSNNQGGNAVIDLNAELQSYLNQLSFESGLFAQQADGDVKITKGSTVVLCTVVIEEVPVHNFSDYIDLTVNYQENTYAYNKIPNGFSKRDAKFSDRETLISRLIDRSIRPLFPKYFAHKVQVTCKVLAYDGINQPDILAMLGTTLALHQSGLPLKEISAACRVGYRAHDDVLIFNPSMSEQKESGINLIVANSANSILMLESEMKEIAQDLVLRALQFAYNNNLLVLEKIATELEKPYKNKDLANAKRQRYLQEIVNMAANIKEIAEKIKTHAIYHDLQLLYKIASKSERIAKIKNIECVVQEFFRIHENSYSESAISAALNFVRSQVIRQQVIDNKVRIDGRSYDGMRSISGETNCLPVVHGSGLFTRGETKVLAIATIGSPYDSQVIDDLTENKHEDFMLYYVFPPYSVGEARPLRGAPGRREIGHGRLACKSLEPVLPSKEDYPYTKRVVCEVLSCNGSSSMASIIAASLAAMDAGIPIKKHVAGIAMGMIKEGDAEIILSDIVGDEDHFGDMDFKIGGTRLGITAMQLDVKKLGISCQSMQKSLHQAQKGLEQILDLMYNIIAVPRLDNPNCPKIEKISISKDKIRDIIGPGGKNIKEICEKSGAKIDIEDGTGCVTIFANSSEGAAKAKDMIISITASPGVGNIYPGKIMKIADFGLFVRISPYHEGLVHISDVSKVVGHRLNGLGHLFEEGQNIEVKVIGIDINKGNKIKLVLHNYDLPYSPIHHGNADEGNSALASGEGAINLSAISETQMLWSDDDGEGNFVKKKVKKID